MTSRPTSTSLLRLASTVQVHVVDDHAALTAGGALVDVAIHDLPLVFSFHHPQTLESALASQPAARDWISASSKLVELCDAGILVADRERATRLASSGRGFASAREHIAMLDDEVRTSTYVDAVREVVEPGDVVVDLGTGTGILAIAAAQAGARKVYAIERTSIADAAKAMFTANGGNDRIELVRGNSTKVNLPERANVLVSEIIGSDPLDEDVLAFTRDAVSRFLAPGARVLPLWAEVYLRPVRLPDDVWRSHVFLQEQCSDWTKRFGMSFEPLSNLRARNPFQIRLSPSEARACTLAGERTCLTRIDLANSPSHIVASTTLKPEAEWDAVLMSTQLALSSSSQLHIDPFHDSTAVHWATPVWVLPTLRPATPTTASYRFTGLRSSLDVHHE